MKGRMEYFTYCELSNKVGEKWNAVKSTNPASKNECVRLQQTIIRIFPTINALLDELKEINSMEVMDVRRFLRYDYDMVLRCLQLVSDEERIDALNEYTRYPDSVVQQMDMERWKNFIRSKSFDLLLRMKDYIDDKPELYSAFQLVLYYVEIQHYIEKIDYDTELERMFDVKPLKSDKEPKKHKENAVVQRNIDVSGLKEYFTLAFKGGGNSTTQINHFSDNLLPDLQADRSCKEFARIACLIYDSGKLINSMKPNTFNAWYKNFCKMVDCQYNKNYKHSNLDINDKFKRKFYYL